MNVGRDALSDDQLGALNFASHRDHTREVVQRATSQLCRWDGVQDLERLATDQVTINFHPDRPSSNGRLVLESVLESGRWQNQFESGSSNGFSLDDKDGVRARSESLLFGGFYDQAAAEERPKYAGLNLYGVRGAWPRFGSCHWRLDSDVLHRCTVTVGGSHAPHAWSGRPQTVLELLAVASAARRPLEGHRFHLIDGPVEVQVHGEVLLDRDIDALVLDPSFRDSRVARVAEVVSDRFGVRIEWGPSLEGDPRTWTTQSARPHARHRLAGAVREDRKITARWIGADLSVRNSSVPHDVRDRAARYLWNRLLLTQVSVALDPSMESSSF